MSRLLNIRVQDASENVAQSKGGGAKRESDMWNKFCSHDDVDILRHSDISLYREIFSEST